MMADDLRNDMVRESRSNCIACIFHVSYIWEADHVTGHVMDHVMTIRHNTGVTSQVQTEDNS